MTADIKDSLLDPQCRYTIMRNDRLNNRVGGVCVLISKNHTSVQVTFGNIYSNLEIVGFDLPNVVPVVRIFVVYRPPYYDMNAELYAHTLTHCITTHTGKNHNHIIVGDLNLPQIKWNSHCCPIDHINKKIFDFVLTHGYSQLVDFPTRGNNIFDVILTDDDSIVTTVKLCPPVGYSDHIAIEFTMTLTTAGRGVTDGFYN